jgi:hypothetical protein
VERANHVPTADHKRGAAPSVTHSAFATPEDEWAFAYEIARTTMERVKRQPFKLLAVVVGGEQVWPPVEDRARNERIDEVLTRMAVAVDHIARAVERQSASAVSAIAPAALSKHAAAFLGVTEETLEQLLRTRKLAFVQHGAQRGRVIAVEDLRAFLQSHRQPTGEELMKRRRS